MAGLRRYDAAVLGAGPAGLAVVGTLLDAGKKSILWADPSFDSGRLSIYGEVPSELTSMAMMATCMAALPTHT